MKPTALLLPRGLFHDLFLPRMQTQHPFPAMNFDAEATADLHHDFLVQNSRPDLVLVNTTDHALWALDLP